MFFAGRFRYRKSGVLLAAVLALLIGASPIIWFAPELPQMKWSLNTTLGAIFVGVFCALFLTIGFKFLRHWFVGATLLLEITTEGVSYGGRNHSWESIQWIGGSAQQGRVQLALKRKGVSPDLPLLVDEPLTIDRYDALMLELSAALRVKYPDVAVG